MGIQGIISPA